MGIDSMRGKENIYMPYEITYEELCDKAYAEYVNKSDKGDLYLHMIQDITIAIYHHRKIAVRVAYRLRTLSWLLLLSLAAAILAVLSTNPYLSGNSP